MIPVSSSDQKGSCLSLLFVKKPHSQKVFQEALLNALSHRDYQNTSAVYVKHYPDKIVIENPGGFLVQRTGQGVDIIFREMISSGKPYPKYHAYNEAVSLTIFSAIDDIEFVKFIAQEQNRLQRSMPLSELMILRYLTDNRQIVLSEIQELAQISADEARRS